MQDSPAPKAKGFDAVARIVSITILGLAIGVVASLAAILFVYLVDVLNDWLLISPRSRILAENSQWLIVATVCVPTLGGLAVGLLTLWIPERRPQGIADIISAVQGSERRVPLRSGLLSATSAVVALGAGASVGQYGPLAHLGATVGSAVAKLTQHRRWMATIGIGCGVAAAISTAFNAPIAGIIFAHEVVLRHYSLRAFAPITVASTIGYVMANLVFERPSLFHVQPVSVTHAPEFLGFVAIGVGGAFLAVLYMQAILYTTRIADKIAIAQYLRPMLAGGILGCAAIWLPDVMGIGREALRFATIELAFAPRELALLLIAKILATALCIGFGFAGGVFGPALLIGVLFGALAGAVAEPIFGDLRSDVVVYAICGMVAVSSAVIGAPLAAILIVFELTRNYDLATAAMVSVVFSNLVSYRLFGRSLFDVQLEARGVDLSLGRDKVVLDHRSIESCVTQEFTRLAPSTSLQEAKLALLRSGKQKAYMLDENGIYLGTITLADIVAREMDGPIRATKVGELAEPEPLIFTGSTTVWEAMKKMGDFVGESIPVVGDDDMRFLGVVFEATVVKAYLDTVHEHRVDENAPT